MRIYQCLTGLICWWKVLSQCPIWVTKDCSRWNISPIENCQQSLKCLDNTFHLFQLQLSRATPALLFVYMAAMVGVGLLGLTGCWQQSANKLILTAAIQVTNNRNHENMKTQTNAKTKTMAGVTGCWQQSANKLILTAAIQVANTHNHEKMKTQTNTKT